MKKTILLLSVILLFGSTSFLKAQCFGVVNYDTAAGANGSNTFNIITNHANELIMIAYDGWPRPGAGPVTVDGNAATHLVTGFDNNNSGIAETYGYIAPSAGTHTIVCTETNYSYPPYGLNFAASFYVTGSNVPISLCNITNTVGTITCTTGGYITSKITTSIPGSMMYDNFENNNGQTGPFTDAWTGAHFLGQLHEGNGIDASQAYMPAPVAGTFSATCGNAANQNNGCGGLVMVMCCIPPPPCIPVGLNAVLTKTPPSCGLCNGVINIAVSGGIPPYTFVWTPNVSTSNNVSGLCAGTYTCAVNDAACPPPTIPLLL